MAILKYTTLKNKDEVTKVLTDAISKNEKDIYLTIEEKVSIEELAAVLHELFYSKEASGVDYDIDNIEELNEVILDYNMLEYYNSKDNSKDGEYECKLVLEAFDLPIRHMKSEVVVELDYFESYKDKRYHWYFDGMSDEDFENYEEGEDEFIPHAMATIVEEVNTYNEDLVCISTETCEVECLVFNAIDEVFDCIRDAEERIDKAAFLESLNNFLLANPQFTTEFLTLLLSHKGGISNVSNSLMKGFMTAVAEHDMDKLFNKETYEIYSEHFAKLKAIPFTDPKYKEYEETHFSKAHFNHNQEAHQFYDYRHKPDTKVDLLLLMEVVIDITVSAKAYGNTDANSIAEIIYKKGDVRELVSYDIILNSVKRVLYNK